MGFLDKAIDAVNRVASPIQNALSPTDPRSARAARVQRDGDAGTGRIVCIHRRPSGEATQTVYAIDVPASPTTAAQRIATEVGTTRHLHRLRPGVEVPVRVDGDRGVIDWPALAQRCGLAGPEPRQQLHGSPPADGILDTAHPNPVLRRLERGRRTTATITALDRVVVLGMPTVNWDVHLLLEDGTAATIAKDEVPPYAWFAAAAGAVVPVAVDERDATAVSVDWAALASAAAATAHLDQEPPPGSLADEVDAASAAESSAPPPAAGATPTDPRATIAAHRDAGLVNASLQGFVDEVHAGRMKPKAFLGILAEWEGAGLCTAAEAAHARSAAGLAG